MSRPRVSAVALALLLGACGSSGNGSEARTKTTAPATTAPGVGTSGPAKPAPTYTTEVLQKLLVPISEVPRGFSVQPPNAGDDETQVCDEAAFPRAQRTARADVSYISGQVAVLSEELTSYASTKEAESVMRNARSAFERCKTFDETDGDGAVTHYTLAPMSFDRLADDQVAFRLTFEADAVSGKGDFVAVRFGSLIMVTAGLSASSEQLDPGVFASFTKTAYERIT